MTVGIVAVSHSRALADAAVELASQMVQERPPAIEVAAGTEDGGLGTDATAVLTAIESADSGDGVVVITDLGSAILSTDMALELLDSPENIRVVPAPFVEGMVAAVLAAATGASLDAVAQQASTALDAKSSQLNDDDAAGAAAPAVGADGAAVTVTLRNPHGLHARPAATLAAAVAKLGVEVTVTANGRTVSATSPLLVTSLGTRGGDTVTVAATGENAEEAAQQIGDLIAGGFGEADDAAPAGEATDAAPTSKHAKGAAEPVATASSQKKTPAGGASLGLSGGRAVAPAIRMAAPVEQPDSRHATDAEAELRSIKDALAAVDADLKQRAAHATDDAVHILEATRTLAADPTIQGAADERVRGGEWAPRAVWDALGEIATQFEAAGGFTAERAVDVRDIRARLVAALTDRPAPGVPDSADPFILVADTLAPADAAALSANCLGLLLAQGGPTSHTAILARGLGIPAVVDAAAVARVSDGDRLLVDGDAGRAIINPNKKDAAGARTTPAKRDTRPFAGPGATADGHTVTIAANVGKGPDIDTALRRGAEGIGLLRTEFAFLGRTEAPGLKEQAALYQRAFAAFPGRKVTVRTLDAGADKPLPFLTPDDEPNPALGVRGYRTSVPHPQVLETQLEAIARAAAAVPGSQPWVMAPMIATAAEAREFAERAHSHGLDQVGVMVEVPAAAIEAKGVLEVVDFVSIGTNDLTQYTMAADRLNTGLAALGTHWQPAVLRLIGMVGDAAAELRAAGLRKSVGVCGEAAGDPVLAGVLVGLGVDSLSMVPALVPTVGRAVAGYTLAQCKAAAEAALASGSAEEAKAAAAAVLK